MFISLKKYYECMGGPWHGHKLRLRSDGTTAVFSLPGWHGRYNRGEWEPK